MVWGPLLAAGTSAVAQFVGRRKTNQANVALARERMGFERSEATRQMEFQERMSSTAHQRSVADLRAAGLNPILAAMQGGASSPGGASGTGAQATVEDPVGPSVSTAMQALLMRKQLKLVDEQTQQVRAQTVKEKWVGDQERVKERFATARWQYYFTSDGRPREGLRNLLQEEHNASMANSAKSISDSRLSALSIPERQALAKLWTQAGPGAKGAQMLMPLILSLLKAGR